MREQVHRASASSIYLLPAQAPAHEQEFVAHMQCCLRTGIIATDAHRHRTCSILLCLRKDVACSLIITASEDQACGFWDARSGRLMQRVSMHGGRGVWCCVPVTRDVLLTGGGDSALRLWRLPFWLHADTAKLLEQPTAARLVGAVPSAASRADTPPTADSSNTAADTAIALQLPQAPDGSALDSVRAMAFADLSRLYIITKAGLLYRAVLEPADAAGSAQSGSHRDTAFATCWAAREAEAPLNCISIIAAADADVVIVGAQSGCVTVLRVAHAPVRDTSGSAPAGVLARAQLTDGAPVLGIYSAKDLPCGQLLVSSTNNIVRFVSISAGNSNDAPHAGGAEAGTDVPSSPTSRAASSRLQPECAPLREHARACTGRQPRVVAAALMASQGLLVVGDVSGGVCAFEVPAQLRQSTSGGWVAAAGGMPAQPPQAEQVAASQMTPDDAVELHMIAKLGSCHGNTPVTMIRCLRDRVYTGGRNGELFCACDVGIPCQHHSAAFALYRQRKCFLLAARVCALRCAILALAHLFLTVVDAQLDRCNCRPRCRIPSAGSALRRGSAQWCRSFERLCFQLRGR